MVFIIWLESLKQKASGFNLEACDWVLSVYDGTSVEGVLDWGYWCLQKLAVSWGTLGGKQWGIEGGVGEVEKEGDDKEDIFFGTVCNKVILGLVANDWDMSQLLLSHGGTDGSL